MRLQRLPVLRAGTEAHDPEDGAAALAAAFRNATNDPAEILEAGYVFLRPVGLARQHFVVGGAAQCFEAVVE